MRSSKTAFLAMQAIPSLFLLFGEHQSKKQYLSLAVEPRRSEDFPAGVGFSLTFLAG